MCPTSGSTTFLIISSRIESANSSLTISDLYFIKKKITILLFKLRILPAAPNGHCFTHPPNNLVSNSSLTVKQMHVRLRPASLDDKCWGAPSTLLAEKFPSPSNHSIHQNPDRVETVMLSVSKKKKKYICCSGSKERKNKPYPPSLACCVSAPPAALVHTVSVDENRWAWQLHWLSQRGQLAEAVVLFWVEKG